MKYIFCSLMFTDVENDIKKSKNPNSVSGHRFQENILAGLLANKVEVCVVNTPRIRRYPDFPKINIESSPFIYKNNKVGINIGFINLYLFSYVTQYFRLYKTIDKIISENQQESYTLLLFNSHLIQNLVIQKLKNKYKNLLTCDIIGDLHGKYGILRKNATLKERLIDMVGRFQDWKAKKFDCFVFLSKHMNEYYRCSEKSFVVVEGIYNKQQEETTYNDNSQSGQKILFYAGSLNVEYDIEHLLAAFSKIKDESFKLYIAGNGNGIGIVKHYERMDSRIKYLGVITPDEVARYQNKATALISPRRNGHSFVKYSFPSKTMECLASGKPFIAHKLDCEPEEYVSYIQYSGESDAELAEKIEMVLNLPEEQRVLIGQNAKEFIVREKNPKKMCKKIIDLCEFNRF